MKIAINGFGRIGRVFLKQALGNPDFEIVAINDLADKDNLFVFAGARFCIRQIPFAGKD